MKILMVVPEFPPDYGGGIVTFYRDLIPALREQGADVSVLKGSAFVHGADSYEYEGIRVSVLRSGLFQEWLNRFGHFSMFPEFRRHLAAAFAMHEQVRQGEGFDVVEVTDWGFLFLPWVISSHARLLVQLHGSTGQIFHHEPVTGREAEGALALLLEKAALASAPGLSSYSRSNAQWWGRVLGRSVEYLPPPLRVEQATTEHLVSDRNWLAVGRIQHWKGPQVAAAAWEKLGSQAPPLDWIGRDTMRGESGESTAAWLDKRFGTVWGKIIQPIGQMAPSDVLVRMKTARAVLVPSTWDVFNLAAAEAMMLGKAVVISSGAGASDLIEHGVNGFVFQSDDSSALADIVASIEAMDSARLETIGNAAALTARDRLDPLQVAEAKIGLYSRLPKHQAQQSSWLRELLSPGAGKNPLRFLDGLPLKELSRYVMHRLVGRVLARRVAL